MTSLIEPAALMGRLGQPGLFILDATALLPGETSNPEENFRAGRIPGARRFDIEVFSDPDSTLPHMAPASGRFAKLFGALGISATDEVVFYDQGNAASACRGWWLARLFGHANVHVLNGGLPGWIAAGGSLETTAPAPAAPCHYVPRLHTALLSGLQDMLDHVVAADAVILDARPAARFEGAAPEPRPGVASGHIPGSSSLPFGKVLDAQKRFLAPEVLRALLEQVGVTAGRPVIVSCGSGMTASALAVAVTEAGFAPASLYDGSWAEWGSTPDAPVETGPGKGLQG